MKLSSSIVSMSACVFSFLSAYGGELKVGTAMSNITTPLGIPIVGNWGKQLATNVHDELHARALVVDDGEKKVAIVVCDLLGFHSMVSNEARKLIQQQTGIPEEHVLISGTHTHSAGDALSSGKRTTADVLVDNHPMTGEMSDYQKFIAARVADAVAMANSRLTPVEMAFGKVDIPEHVFNRRWSMREGTMPPNPFGKTDKAKMNPPAGSADLVEPVGPTDPTLSFVAFREPGGRLLSLFAAYSLHYVGGVKSGDVSADYFAVFCEELKKRQPEPEGLTSPPFMAMLANGTSGDINSVNFREPRPAGKPYEKMHLIGKDVADKVDGALKSVTWKKEGTVDARFKNLPVRRRPVDPELKAWAEETSKKEVPEGTVNLPKIYALRVLNSLKLDQTVKTPLHYIRIGEVGIGSMPVEVFAETGMDFRKRAPLPQSFMISMAHNYLGYLPPSRHLELGGYETWHGTNQLEAGAEKAMLDTVLEMAAEAKP